MKFTRKSRPTTRFVNVGSAFMNARELAKRQVAVSLRIRLTTFESGLLLSSLTKRLCSSSDLAHEVQRWQTEDCCRSGGMNNE